MNVLAIGAHFDDIELGCGGALAKHVANGGKVYAYVATRSGFKDHNNIEVRSNIIAEKEGDNAMKILGVSLIKGNFQTLHVEFIDDLNLDVLRIVEDKKIDLVYLHWMGDVHHDHQAVARASLHSCRHVPRQLMYRSNWYHSNIHFKENFYVDISDYWDIKKKAIEAHQSEMGRTGKKWIEFFYNESKNAGQRIGVEKAEVFEVVKWID
jgi:LmbE family N-acetylglucosaminyl deacetylase